MSGNPEEKILRKMGSRSLISAREDRNTIDIVKLPEGYKDQPISLDKLEAADYVALEDGGLATVYLINHKALFDFLAMDSDLAKRMKEKNSPPFLSQSSDVTDGISHSDAKGVYLSIEELEKVDLKNIDGPEAHERAHIKRKDYLRHPKTLAESRARESATDIMASDYVKGGAKHYADTLEAMGELFPSDSAKPEQKMDHPTIQHRKEKVLAHGALLAKAGAIVHEGEPGAQHTALPKARPSSRSKHAS